MKILLFFFLFYYIIYIKSIDIIIDSNENMKQNNLILDKNNSFELVYCKHGVFLIPKGDTYISKSLHNYGEWSEDEIILFQHIIKKGDVIYDIGAHIGSFTIPFGNIIGSHGRLHAFEPQPFLFEINNANIVLNHHHYISKVHNYAMDNIHEDGNYISVPRVDYLIPSNYGAISLLKEYTDELNHRNDDYIPITSIDLFTFKERKRINDKLFCPNFIKVDVEGMDESVLRGGSFIIKECKPILFIENNCEETSPSLINTILNYEYDLFWVISPIYNPNNFFNNKNDVFKPYSVSMNMIAIPKNYQNINEEIYNYIINNYIQIDKEKGLLLRDYNIMLELNNRKLKLIQMEICHHLE